MNNKIAILTFHDSHNCGSMLQAYALQSVLRDKYHQNVEILDFATSEQKKLYAIVYKPESLKQFLRLCLNLVFYFPLKKQSDSFIFFKRYFNLTEPISNKLALSQKARQYAKVFTGSDQIWNIACKDADTAYFASFKEDNPIECYSYAVSMGATDINDYPQQVREEYKKYLNGYKKISVREMNASLWIEKLIGEKVTIMPDPTLLIAGNTWESLALPAFTDKKYVFWYCMNYKSKERKAVQNFAKKHNLEIYMIDCREWTRRMLFFHNINLIKCGGPQYFLTAVKNAEYIITSSFHGTVFASLLHKDFLYLKSGNVNGKDDRATFLLSQLGLSDRLISCEELSKITDVKEIDFTLVDSRIEKLRIDADNWFGEIFGVVGNE